MCPECGKPLIAIELDGVEVDCCLACGGLWLDPGELEHLTTSAGETPGPLFQALHHARLGRKSQRRCPRCRRRLMQISVGDRPPLQLDRCPRGHGLWFEAGEMETLITEFKEGETGTVARFFADVFRHRRASN